MPGHPASLPGVPAAAHPLPPMARHVSSAHPISHPLVGSHPTLSWAHIPHPAPSACPQIGADIVKRALPYSLKLIANNAGDNGSVVMQVRAG